MFLSPRLVLLQHIPWHGSEEHTHQELLTVSLHRNFRQRYLDCCNLLGEVYFATNFLHENRGVYLVYRLRAIPVEVLVKSEKGAGVHLQNELECLTDARDIVRNLGSTHNHRVIVVCRDGHDNAIPTRLAHLHLHLFLPLGAWEHDVRVE